MIRTQIMLPVGLKKALKRKAEKKDLSMSELIRKYLYEKIIEEQTENDKNVLLEMSSNAAEGKSNVSSENFRSNYDNLNV